MFQSRSTETIRGRRTSRWLLALPVLALFGLADSGYLLRQHRAEGPAFCLAGSCDVVNRGAYSEIKGIPLAAFGIGAYLLLLALSTTALALESRRVLGVVVAIAGIGMAVSAWLIYLQVAVIEALCMWCVLSALTMTSLFAVSLSGFLTMQRWRRLERPIAEHTIQMSAGGLQRAFRFPLMASGMIALFAALVGGIARLGWDWSVIPSTLPTLHGPLMISGFLGTLIGLERAVAIRKWWPSLGPLSSGLSALLLITKVPGVVGPVLLTLGSAILVLTFIHLIREQPALFTVTMGLGALAWLAGNILWLSGWAIADVVSWWATFLIFTVAGERLELSRFLPLARRHRLSFLAAIALVAAWLIPTGMNLNWGTRLSGVGLVALSVWLLRHDMARYAVHKTGLHRFVALSLLSGYVWLSVAGLLALYFGGASTGMHHDATLHAIPEHSGPDGYDATLHAIFVGFVFSMIIGHAPIIFPSVLGMALPFRPAFYSHLALLHLSLGLRVIGDITTWWPGRLWGGSLNAAAVLLFLGNMAVSAVAGRSAGEITKGSL